MLAAIKAALGRSIRPSYVASAEAAATSATPAVTCPSAGAGAAAGQLAIAVVHGVGGNIPAPSGWTQIGTQATSSTAGGIPFSVTAVFRKRLESGDIGASLSFPVSGGTVITWVCSVHLFDKADVSAPIGVSGKTEVSSGVASSIAGPSLATSPRDDVINFVAYTANSGSFGSIPTITPNRGTTRSNLDSNGALRGVVATDTDAVTATRSAAITTANGTPSAVACTIVGR